MSDVINCTFLFTHINDFGALGVFSACCEEGKYGPVCLPCKGGAERPCRGNGNCGVSVVSSESVKFLFIHFFDKSVSVYRAVARGKETANVPVILGIKERNVRTVRRITFKR